MNLAELMISGVTKYVHGINTYQDLADFLHLCQGPASLTKGDERATRYADELLTLAAQCVEEDELRPKLESWLDEKNAEKWAVAEYGKEDEEVLE